MKELYVKPLSNLSGREKLSLLAKGKLGWHASGIGPFWSTVENKNRAVFDHVAVYRDGQFLYDTVRKTWKPGVLVLPVRFNTDGQAEFYLIKERRVLSEKKVAELAIPGGLLNDNENYSQGAKRELHEETGLKTDNLVMIGNVRPEPVSSPSLFPVYLAHIPYTQENTTRVPDHEENIEGGDWYGFEEILGRPIEDGRLLSTLMLVSRVLPDKVLFKTADQREERQK